MSVGAKLNLAFYSIIVLLCISVGINFLNLSNIEKKTGEALDDRFEQIRVIEQIRFDLAMQGLYARGLIMETTEENYNQLMSYAESLDAGITELKEMYSSDIMDDYWNEMNSHNNEFNKVVEEVIAALKKGNLADATILVNTTLEDANNGILDTSNKMVEYQNEQLTIIKEETRQSVVISSISSVIVLIISIIIFM